MIKTETHISMKDSKMLIMMATKLNNLLNTCKKEKGFPLNITNLGWLHFLVVSETKTKEDKSRKGINTFPKHQKN